MSDTHASTAPDSHGGHDEHGHAADTIGPIDIKMWGVGLLSVIAAVVIAACFVVATGFRFGA